MATVREEQESRVVLRNVSWATYDSLLADHADTSAPRFVFDQGVLEIMSPLPEHERYKRAIESLMDVLALEQNVSIDSSFGSTTFRSQDMQRGFEPDACFYIENEPRVRGRSTVDLSKDPPPDVVVEIDITSPSLAKFPVYAAFGVPEVWRYDGERVEIWVLREQGYEEASESEALPIVSAGVLWELLEKSKRLERLEWLRRVRDWAKADVHRGSEK